MMETMARLGYDSLKTALLLQRIQNVPKLPNGRIKLGVLTKNAIEIANEPGKTVNDILAIGVLLMACDQTTIG